MGRYRVAAGRRWTQVVLLVAWLAIEVVGAVTGFLHPLILAVGLAGAAGTAVVTVLDWRTHVELDERGITVQRLRRVHHGWGLVRGVGGRDGWIVEIIDGDDVRLPDVADMDQLLDTIAVALGASRRVSS